MDKLVENKWEQELANERRKQVTEQQLQLLALQEHVRDPDRNF